MPVCVVGLFPLLHPFTSPRAPLKCYCHDGYADDCGVDLPGSLNRAKELLMEKAHTGRYSFLIALVVLMNVGMVWAQANEEKGTSIKETLTECSTVTSIEYEHTKDINDQRLSTNGVMVAEDMRCRQCRGKCTAENLRCRSQCLGDSTCLAQCEERSSTCGATCKQLFSCE